MPPDATDQARALLKSLRWWDEDGWARDHGYDALDVQAAEAALSAAREAGKAEGLKRAAEGSSPMLAAGILAVRDLIGDSRGVAGLHRNAAESRGEQRARVALRPAAEALRAWLTNANAVVPLGLLDVMWEVADWVFPELARAEKVTD